MVEIECHLLQPAAARLREWVQPLTNYLSGSSPLPELPYDVKATAFQLQAWQALQTILIGTAVTYSDIAHSIGQPTAIRAVARAYATNPVLIVLCHWVVPKAVGLGDYRWGITCKHYWS